MALNVYWVERPRSIKLKVLCWMTTEQQSTEFPKRVMLVIHSMRGGGAERQMSYLANEMVTRSATSLVTLAETGNDAYLLDSRIERIGLGLTTRRGGLFRGLFANISRIRAIRRWIRSWRPDVVVSFCDSTNILTLIACPSKIPVVISERSDPRRQKLSRFWELLRKKYYPKCKICIAQTNEVGGYLISHRLVAPSKIIVIPSAIKIPKMDTRAIEAARKWIQPKILIYLGRLSREKRVDRLLKAWASLTEHHLAWQLRIIGDGLERASLQTMATELGIEKGVQWTLWSDEIWSSLFSANAYCLVSEYEGFPQSMLEAMASGLPVAVLDCSPSIRLTISNGVDGLIIPSEDQISSVLNRLLSSESLCNSLGQSAATRARDFEWCEIAPHWLAAIATATS